MQAPKEFLDFFQCAPPEIDPGAVFHAWQALSPGYVVETRRPPVPVWARRPYSENGNAAWQALREDLAAADPGKAMCLYVHVPFCEEKCAFCDCYSFRLHSHVDAHVHRYVDTLRQEIALWSSLDRLKNRPISTVHFGGGTPVFLGPVEFRRLVEAIREAFPNHLAAEWALETTSSALTPEIIETLAGLGFTRIHIGAQTLADPIRALLRRRETGAAVLQKIAPLAARGMVVSVDLLYGLPRQSLENFLADIRRLADYGVDGFSLYPLQISSRNRAILNAYAPDQKSLLREFWMIQAAEQLLRHSGYSKTLFNHYARSHDTNLYFTFPERGEDCLALGTIADGVFGSYHYRHPEYMPYLKQVSQAFPALQGGLRRSQVENQLFPLETAILSGAFQISQFIDVLGSADTSALIDEWIGSNLIYPDGDSFRLTASGSWFVGTMMKDVARRFAK